MSRRPKIGSHRLAFAKPNLSNEESFQDCLIDVLLARSFHGYHGSEFPPPDV